MDKKEFNSLIDRISLTGPGGVDKIKKILKELSVGGPLGFIGEDEEYTIAQALNDLNERIAALESAPAPQPETHILEITQLIQDASQQEVLNLLRLDGKIPTLEELKVINPINTYLLWAGTMVTCSRVDIGSNWAAIEGGYYRNNDNYYYLGVLLDAPNSNENSTVYDEP